jgi:hypothetical protein
LTDDGSLAARLGGFLETTKGGFATPCFQPATERNLYEMVANAAVAIDTDNAASQPNAKWNSASASCLVALSCVMLFLSFSIFILNLLNKSIIGKKHNGQLYPNKVGIR